MGSNQHDEHGNQWGVPPDSIAKRYALVGLGLLHTIFTAGVVFGWPGLVTVLTKDGVYESLCPKGQPHCPDRSAKLHLVFNMGATGNYLSNVPFGWLLDTYGPRTSSLVASAGFGLGILLCLDEAFLPYGFFLLGFTGPGIQLATLHLSNMFPDKQSTLLGASTSCFDAGAIVFLGFKVVHDSFDVKAHDLFTGFLLVPAFVFLTALAFWPRHAFRLTEIEIAESPGGRNQPRFGALPFKEMIRTQLFWFLCAFATIHICRLNFIVGTMHEQLLHTLPDDKADELTTTFSSMLPFGFVVFPVYGWLTDNHGPITAFQTVTAVGVAYGAAMLIRGSTVALIIVFMLVAVSRQMVYSCVFSMIAKEFGFVHLGKLSGLINIFVACGGAVNFGLSLAALYLMDGEYFAVNTIVLLFALPLLGAPYWLSGNRNEQTPMNAEGGERRPLMGIGGEISRPKFEAEEKPDPGTWEQSGRFA